MLQRINTPYEAAGAIPNSFQLNYPCSTSPEIQRRPEHTCWLCLCIRMAGWEEEKKKEEREKMDWTSAFSISLWGTNTVNGASDGVGSTLQLRRLAATSCLEVARKDVMKCVLWGFMLCIVEKPCCFLWETVSTLRN